LRVKEKGFGAAVGLKPWYADEPALRNKKEP